MMIRARGIVAAAALLGSAIGLAQRPVEDRQVIDRIMKARLAGDYLSPPSILRPLAWTDDGKVRDERLWSRWQEAEGLITGEPPIHPAPSLLPGQTDQDRATIARIAHATAKDALAEIVAGARKTRIVILNEHHLVPRSRAFATQVARALRPLGYNVFAAETFSNTPDPAQYAKWMAELTADGYVRRGEGFYTADPVFASLVREVLSLGYRPVAYETTDLTPRSSTDEGIRAREQAQTDYLMTRALAAHPGAKILIYVGHTHVAEVPVKRTGEAIAWMAARLKRASGIDPLTIDQTEFLMPAADPTGITAAAIERAKGRSVVLVDHAGPVQAGFFANAVDLQVIHPRLSPVAGRPGWLAALGRHAVPVPKAMLPTAGRRLVQAFPAGAADDAVPIDQVVVEAGRPPPALMLDRRPYALRFRDPSPQS